MNKGSFFQGKQQRASDKAKKKREKAKRKELRREQASDEPEFVTAEDIVGRLPSSTEAMLAMEERAKAPRQRAKVPCRLFVGSLNLDTTEEALRKHFSKLGTVTDAAILKDRSSGKSRGFGFVTLDNRRDGTRAVEQLNGSELDGHNIVVNVATER